MLAATMLPALHALGHYSSGTEVSLDRQETKQSLSGSILTCELCDFHFSNSDAPQLFTFDLLAPQKEIVYAISLTETINPLPLPFFSLRAPPAVIA